MIQSVRRALLGAGPGQGRVAPFAADLVDSLDGASAHDHSAATAGAQDRTEHHLRAGPGAVHGLGERETVGVVLHADRAAQHAFKVLVERLVVEPNAVGVTHQARRGRQGARHAHAHPGPRRAGVLFDERDNLADRFQSLIVVARVGESDAGDHLTVVGQSRGLDLRTPKIDANPYHSGS